MADCYQENCPWRIKGYSSPRSCQCVACPNRYDGTTCYATDNAEGYRLSKEDDAPTITTSGWVSVEERLPTDEHPVLVFVGYADTTTGFITTSSYFCFDENPHWQWDGLVRDEQRTLFWMPLPEPPTKET